MMPSVAQWNQILHEARLPLEIDPQDFAIDHHSGYLPCRFRGVATGFEMAGEWLDDRMKAELELPDGLDYLVTLAASRDGFVASLLAAGALCHASGGILDDPQSGERVSSESSLAWAWRRWAEADRPNS